MTTSFKTNTICNAVKVVLIGLSCSLSQSLLAQEAGAPKLDETNVIEHIKVTSRNRDETLDKIPISVLSYSSKEIQAAGLENINDIAANAVGFSMEKTFGRQADIPVIRGVSWIPGFGSQKASYFIDGVYFGGSIQSLPLDLIERVEVVKGPQSALYGRRTFSGAINYITKRPSDEFSGYAKVVLGQNGNQELSGGISSKINDVFAFRASLSYDDYDSEFENTKEDGPGVGGEQSKSAMLGLYYTPNNRTEIALNYLYSETDDEHVAFQFQDASFNNCFEDTRAYYCGEAQRGLPVSIGGILDNAQYGLRTESTHLSFSLKHHFDVGTLTWLSGLNTYDAENGVDQTYAGNELSFSFATFGLAPATDWHTFNSSKSEEYSHEIRFNSEALNDKLMWAVGAYIWQDEQDPEVANAFTEELDNTAFMASTTYEFTNSFRLSGEIRRSKDKVNTEAYDNLIATSGFENTKNEFSSTTTRFIAEYDFSDDTLFYFTRAEGNSPGRFNTDATLPADLITVKEEKMLMYELGIKSTLLDGAFYYSAAIYNMDWTNQQFTDSFQPDSGVLPVSYVSNAGETEIQGFELQGKLLINDNFNMDFGYSRTNAKFVELFDGNQCRFFAPTTYGSNNTLCQTAAAQRQYGNASGNTPPQVPKNEALLALNYVGTTGENVGLFGRVDMTHDSSRYAHIHNFIETGSKTTVNARFGVQLQNWTVTAWAKNLMDDDTPTYVFRYIDTQSFFLAARAFPIAPRRGREFGVTTTFTF